MRNLSTLLLAMVLSACSTAPVPKAPSETPLDYLLSSAAKDFRTHAPHPARFRGVRFGHLTNADGTTQYRLCGEFLALDQTGQAQWMPFVTIRTSGYEQYVGAQGKSFCEDLTPDSEEDLSSSLQRRFESLK